MELIQKVKQILIDNPKVVAVVLLAFLLTTILYVARAGAPFVAIEAETSASSQVIVKQSQSASGGAYAEFPAIATPPTDDAPDYPGQPAPGRLFWGATVESGVDLVSRYETPTGKPLGLHRSFFQWNHRTTGYAMSVVNDDVANGRLPWISFKTPSWADMAAGNHDSEIDYILEQLDAVNSPVWLTIHHEPEGGGGVNAPDDPAGPSGHVAMNRRVRERMTALGTDNIALTPIFMSWTWDDRSGRNPDQWWEPGIYDFLGIDHYTNAESTLLTNVWYEIRDWAATKEVDIAVGEWGMRGSDTVAGNRVNDWYDDAAGSHNDNQGARVVGLAAFDTNQDASQPYWRLTGSQFDVFLDLMKDSRSAYVSQ